MLILVFSECFCPEVWIFSTFKYRVKGGINLSKLCAVLKLKADLIFINGVVINVFLIFKICA